MRKARLTLLGGLVLVGCMGSSQPRTTGVPMVQAPQVEMTTQVSGPVAFQVKIETDKRTLLSPEPGLELRSGERWAVQVAAQRPAYVYAIYATGKEQAEVIFPSSTEAQPKPQTLTRIPQLGEWFQMDQKTGIENLFILTSTELLDLEDLRKQCEAATALNQASPPAQASPVSSSTASKRKGLGHILGPRDRGFGTVKEATEERAFPEGILLKRFWFRHVR